MSYVDVGSVSRGRVNLQSCFSALFMGVHRDLMKVSIINFVRSSKGVGIAFKMSRMVKGASYHVPS